ncbi:antibiotic biosynthesis monooxygenase family protein [Radiobacillus sp. PE A8.2]|uniref:antibiotic biosynthesis monooxygenase family protein n=1 Tax=Radiobacillus sp. PE A8.2 TaxID=3380349 RepID=UPI0038911244
MNAYLTSGTLDYLLQVSNDNPGAHTFIMGDETNTVVYHESKHASIFAEPRGFEIIVEKGQLKDYGFVVMNNIPVTDEGKPIFETQFKQRAGLIEGTPGFHALRVLRPTRGNTYVVMVQWQDKQSYDSWKNSDSFQKSHAGKNKKEKPPYAAGPSYVTSYKMIELDE